MKCRLTLGFLKLEEAIADEVLLTQLVEGEYPWRSELDIGREDSDEDIGTPGRPTICDN
jgi:hypothetical protein